jgi:hypothetical protein
MDARIDLIHPRHVFVDGLVEVVDVDAVDSYAGAVELHHCGGAAADQVRGCMQSLRPRALAEASPVP